MPESKESYEEMSSEVTQKLSLELADIAKKWGFRFVLQKYGFENMCVFQTKSWDVEPEITITSDIREGKQTVIVSKGTNASGFHPFGNPELEKDIKIPLRSISIELTSPSGLLTVKNLEEGMLMIDKAITPSELIKAVNEINQKAKEKGLLLESGQIIRKPLPETLYIQPEKFKVKDVFANKGSLFPVFSPQDPEEIRKMFDKPNEIMAVTDSYNGQVIGFGHVRDREYFEKRAEVVNDVLLEYGLTFNELLTGLEKSPKIFAPIMQKIRNESEKLLKD